MGKLRKFYKGKKVLVTGHTGFKGSWLSLWLLELGAKVIGYSRKIPSRPSNFKACNLQGKLLAHYDKDICDTVNLSRVFKKHAPEIVFHLAAQPIVRRSYAEPKKTFSTNIGGTINVLDCIRKNDFVRSAVIITSDKCYKNRDKAHGRGYREEDILGGDDPYSASKAAAELVFHSYYKSFFGFHKNICRIASARAGNVIGGGDWAEDRIIPDCVRAIAGKKKVLIRNPRATRPWQHVLESLSGYLWLACQLAENKDINGEAFNFGPRQSVANSVEDLIKNFNKYFGPIQWKAKKDKKAVKEHLFLKLSCDKGLKLLGWHSVLSFEKTVKMTADWYRHFYESRGADMFSFSNGQIREYVSEAQKEGLEWTRG